jgi:hypothetical protein
MYRFEAVAVGLAQGIHTKIAQIVNYIVQHGYGKVNLN